uniref:Uncharacterized protein n=1 Tax=Glossina brevipalpis TaxID=37001 RepID=A0A1A9WQ49_9MUSC
MTMETGKAEESKTQNNTREMAKKECIDNFVHVHKKGKQLTKTNLFSYPSAMCFQEIYVAWRAYHFSKHISKVKAAKGEMIYEQKSTNGRKDFVHNTLWILFLDIWMFSVTNAIANIVCLPFFDECNE